MGSQLGILAPVPRCGRYVTFRAAGRGDPRPILEGLGQRELGEGVVVGLGASLLADLGCQIPGHREFPAMVGPKVTVPSTPAALWCWFRGDDPGEVLHESRTVAQALGECFFIDEVVDGFMYAGGRDLTGYEDGTENPTGDRAFEAALTRGAPGLEGSSFVAVQRWRHDLDRFQAFDPVEQDNIIGRRRSDNEELDNAPSSAHVKRTAQESFEPEAFLLRRSMPWADATGEGLMFVAFGSSLDPFEAQLRRMVGHEDGVTDGLFRFSTPTTGRYFWCPPTVEGRLDFSATKLS